MIYLTVTFLLLLTATPIAFKLRAIISLGDKKVFYSIKLFSLISINSGFVDFTRNRAVLRYARRKAKPLYYKDMIPDENQTEVLKHLDFTEFTSAILLGGEDGVGKLSFCSIANNASGAIYALLKEYKPFLKFKNDLILLDKEDKSGGLIQTNVVINGVGIMKILIKKLYEGVLNYVQRKVGKQN